MTPPPDSLLHLILELSYMEGDFTLASGRKSRYYVNTKPVLLDPRGALAFASWVLADMEDLPGGMPDAMGGLELGAVPPAVSITTLAAARELPKAPRSVLIRKAKKGHGTSQRIEGTLISGDRVVVLDDVITTGGSTLQAIEVLEAAGATVERVYCVVDRRDDPVPALDRYEVRGAYRLDELAAAAARK